MSEMIDRLIEAHQAAVNVSSKMGGFPYFAESLRRAEVIQNVWYLPSCQSIYITKFGSIIHQGAPLVTGFAELPPFDKEALIEALRDDQSGRTTFPEFLKRAWDSGVVSYRVDFEKRVVTYMGAAGDFYSENYPSVEI